MTITATPTVQFTDEEFTTIFDTVSWEIDVLADRRRGGDEFAAELEDYLETFSDKLGSIDPNKDGLYNVVLDQETYTFIAERMEDAWESYEENCDDPDYDYDPSYPKVLESIDKKIG